jgi:uncharacterized protein (DUF58 family)
LHPAPTGFFNVIPADWLRRLRHVEVRARLVSEQLLGGRLASVFKGRGMDFADVREYVPGDDVRRIDWNVTARLRRPFIKRHVEERELVVMLLVDGSASGHFGTAPEAAVARGDAAETQRELAAILAGALAFSAVRDGDRCGLLLFTDRIERYVPPRKTRPHVTRLLHELLHHAPDFRDDGVAVARRHVMVGHAEGQVRPRDPGIAGRELVEGQERAFVQEVPVHPQQRLAILARRDGVGVPDLVDDRSRCMCHCAASCTRGSASGP